MKIFYGRQKKKKKKGLDVFSCEYFPRRCSKFSIIQNCSSDAHGSEKWLIIMLHFSCRKPNTNN